MTSSTSSTLARSFFSMMSSATSGWSPSAPGDGGDELRRRDSSGRSRSGCPSTATSPASSSTSVDSLTCPPLPARGSGSLTAAIYATRSPVSAHAALAGIITRVTKRQARGVQRRRHRDHHDDHGPGARAAPRGTLEDLAPLLPIFLAYVLSFAHIAIYWNNHHHLLQAAQGRERARALGEHAPAVLAVARALRDGLDRARPLRPVPDGALRRRPASWPRVAYGFLVLALRAAPGQTQTLAEALGNDFKGRISPVHLRRSRSRSRSWRPGAVVRPVRARRRDVDRPRPPDRAAHRDLTRHRPTRRDRASAARRDRASGSALGVGAWTSCASAALEPGCVEPRAARLPAARRTRPVAGWSTSTDGRLPRLPRRGQPDGHARGRLRQRRRLVGRGARRHRRVHARLRLGSARASAGASRAGATARARDGARPAIGASPGGGAGAVRGRRALARRGVRPPVRGRCPGGRTGCGRRRS